jgi:hypothetical protein
MSSEPSTAIVPSYDPRDPYEIRDGVARRWLTKDKRSLLIADMADQHLLNTIRFIERGLRAKHDSALRSIAIVGTFNGEMASYYASGEADLAMDEYIRLGTILEPVLKGLRAEAQRRGLPELVP